MDGSLTPTARHRARRWQHRWLLLGVPAGVLAILTINVLASGPLVGADQRSRTTEQTRADARAGQWLGGPARLIVDLADPLFCVPVLLVSALTVSCRHRSLRPLLAAAVAVALLLVTVIPAKIMIGRLAPGQLHMVPGGLGSFPSGHATTASVCYVLGAAPLLPYLPAWTRRAALAALPVWCFLIGAALVWGDYHWFTDVAAGWALAAIIIQLTVGLTRDAYRDPSTPSGAPDERLASPLTT